MLPAPSLSIPEPNVWPHRSVASTPAAEEKAGTSERRGGASGIFFAASANVKRPSAPKTHPRRKRSAVRPSGAAPTNGVALFLFDGGSRRRSPIYFHLLFAVDCWGTSAVALAWEAGKGGAETPPEELFAWCEANTTSESNSQRPSADERFFDCSLPCPAVTWLLRQRPPSPSSLPPSYVVSLSSMTASNSRRLLWYGTQLPSTHLG